MSSYTDTKAQIAMHRAGFDPALAGGLSAWAADAIDRAARGDQPHGVIVDETGEIIAETGEIIAETWHHRDISGGAGAVYVVDVDAARWDIGNTEVGLALGTLRQVTGHRVAHVPYSQLCLGSGATAASEATRLGIVALAG